MMPAGRVLGALWLAAGLLVGVWVGREWESRSWDRQRHERFMQSCTAWNGFNLAECELRWLKFGGR